MTHTQFENILKNIPEILHKSRNIISTINVYGESGAGLVKVKLNGKKEVLKIHIDHVLIKENKIIIEDLIKEAVNNANRKVDIEINKNMIKNMKEMGIPHHFISMLPFFDSK